MAKSTALKKITTRAKHLRRLHPGTKWITAVKKAGAEYRAGKIGKAAKKKKTDYRQTGTSSKSHDEQRKAKPPGKRKSRSGKTYYERRKNRSDKPGTLTGVTTGSLSSELKNRLKGKLGRELVAIETATTRTAWHRAKKRAAETKKELRKLL